MTAADAARVAGLLDAADLTGAGPPERFDITPGVSGWSIRLPSAPDALTTWSRLRPAFDSSGLWPVLADEWVWQPAQVGADLAQMTPVDVDQWMSATRSSDEYFDFDRGPQPEFDPEDAWRLTELVADEDVDRVLLVPAPHGWAVPGTLDWSRAANDTDVDGSAHTAVLRRWYDRYEAELVLLRHDVMVLRVGRPPVSREAALAAAWELATYCPDLVQQGVQVLDRLASLTPSGAWWFWWD